MPWFTTRAVPRSGPVWQLPRADHALDFSYTYRGASYTSDQFLDRTYTDALLVMKGGRISGKSAATTPASRTAHGVVDER